MNEELPSSEEVISDGPRFNDFELPPEILEAVAGMGYETPSPIQELSLIHI